MRRGIIGGSRRAVGESPGNTASVDFLRFGRRGEGGFEREGVLLEPVEKSALPKEAEIGILRSVDMSV